MTFKYGEDPRHCNTSHQNKVIDDTLIQYVNLYFSEKNKNENLVKANKGLLRGIGKLKTKCTDLKQRNKGLRKACDNYKNFKCVDLVIANKKLKKQLEHAEYVAMTLDYERTNNTTCTSEQKRNDENAEIKANTLTLKIIEEKFHALNVQIDNQSDTINKQYKEKDELNRLLNLSYLTITEERWRKTKCWDCKGNPIIRIKELYDINQRHLDEIYRLKEHIRKS